MVLLAGVPICSRRDVGIPPREPVRSAGLAGRRGVRRGGLAVAASDRLSIVMPCSWSTWGSFLSAQPARRVHRAPSRFCLSRSERQSLHRAHGADLGRTARCPLATIAIWMLLGTVGTAIAAWRLRPTCLGPKDGDRIGRRSRRRWRIPPLDERPMLWKELYIERAGSIGRFGRWIGWAFVASMGLGSLTLAAIYLWGLWSPSNSGWDTWALSQMQGWIGYSGPFVSSLIR